MDQTRPIPSEFYSSDTQAPIEHCLMCGIDLLNDETEYFIERVFRRVPSMNIVEPLFEFAVCMDCATNMRQDLSVESKKRVEEYFMQNASLRMDTDEKLNRCLLSGKDISECSEFSLHAHCRGTNLVESIFPYAISDFAMDEIAALLSQETLDELDRFKGKYFTGPPELADFINPKRLLPL